MNTTAPKKTHIYAVAIKHDPSAPVVDARVFVRAESMAQARNHVAATMIEVSRATTDEVLDLKRADLIDATGATDPSQAPLAAPDDAQNPPEPFGSDFISGIDHPEG